MSFKKRKFEHRDTHVEREHNVKMEAEIEIMHLQAKEQGLAEVRKRHGSFYGSVDTLI